MLNHSQADLLSLNISEMDSCIPVFDLAELLSPQNNQNKERFRKCLEEWGCFRITNHGISSLELDTVDKACREAFQAQDETKKKYGGSEQYAYLGKNPKLPIYESLSIVESVGVRFFCATFWPNGQNSELSHGLEIFVQKLKKLSQDLYRIILGNLGVEKYNESIFKRSYFRLRMNYYYEREENAQKSLALPAHTDGGVFTIVKEDQSVRGLQVHRQITDDWVNLEPCSSALTIFLGDILRAWSNGRIHNPKHRVIAEPSQAARLSIAFFNHFPIDTEIYAPEELVDADHPRKYRPFFPQEYSLAKYGNQKNNPKFDEVNVDSFAAISTESNLS